MTDDEALSEYETGLSLTYWGAPERTWIAVGARAS
jgi:hypothetical protein